MSIQNNDYSISLTCVLFKLINDNDIDIFESIIKNREVEVSVIFIECVKRNNIQCLRILNNKYPNKRPLFKNEMNSEHIYPISDEMKEFLESKGYKFGWINDDTEISKFHLLQNYLQNGNYEKYSQLINNIQK